MDVVSDCSLHLDMNRLWLLGKREVVGDYTVVLYTFDLLGMKSVLGSAFMVCSRACQGTVAASLFRHTIWNESSQRDPQHRTGRAETTPISSLLRFC